MKPVVALLSLMILAACQVTTSQSMGNGVTIRHDVPLDGEQAMDDPAIDDQDADAKADRKPELTIGGGFGGGVSR